jgi:putative 2OG-Fe(II) oxygenase
LVFDRGGVVELSSLISSFKEEGFVNIGSAPLSSEELDELIQLSMSVASRLSSDHPHVTKIGNLAEVVQCLPQHHPRISELLDSIFLNPDLQLVLKSVLGPDYKIWQINFRRAMPGDRGLYLHQDPFGEVNLIILASESSNSAGATIFLPGSHLAQKTMKEFKIEIPPYLLMKIRDLFTPLIGKVGDIALFFNRTWHGRYSNDSKNSHDCIMVSFYPAGVFLTEGEGYSNWSTEFLSKIEGTELSRLIDPSIGTEKQKDGRFKILSRVAGDDDIPYTLSIETPRGQQQRSESFKLRVTILFIKMFMGVLRPIMPLARRIRLMLGK